jgi:hypothetical protein
MRKLGTQVGNQSSHRDAFSNSIPAFLDSLLNCPLRASVSPWLLSLFDVLNHFAEAFDGGFDFDHVAGDFDIAGFGADRVNFAEHFLCKKL